MKRYPQLIGGVAMVLASVPLPAIAHAQAQPAPPANCLPKNWFDPPPPYQSVEVLADGRVTFRLCAPLAKQAKVLAGDIPAFPGGLEDGVAIGLPMTRDATGLWTLTTPMAVPADTYRFNFQVDGAPVPDPRGATWSQHVNGIESTFEVPGPAGAFQAYDPAIPHGAVSVIEYSSTSIGAKRRAHVYTPPGYMNGTKRLPVLYLVHGAGDSDDAWTSVGRAHYILDNLIASGKAEPMIVVMPAGHTPVRPNQDLLRNEDFGNDLTRDLIPLIDRSFRTIARPQSRAMAGLSMGGAHTLNFGLTRPDLIRYVGIFSMGLGVRGGQEQIAAYEQVNGERLREAAKDHKLVYYAMGKTDFLYESAAPTRAMMDRHAIPYVYHESEGGHTWINWRRYLDDFVPRLFK
jgi:enterochelin esterase-like enzyme